MGQLPLGRIVAGFRYSNKLDEANYGKIVKIVGRAPRPMMGEPTFVIELDGGERRFAVARDLQPWYEVVASDQWAGVSEYG